jgi:prepilin-type processing-associated H-X9-DG protein
MAVAADRNPFIESPAAAAEDMTDFIPDLPPAFSGSSEQAKIANALAHQRDGQNVLFLDSHVEFEKRAFCGIEDDNIYTYMLQGSDPPTSPVGEYPIPYSSEPGTRKDSYVVHDGEGTVRHVR